MISIKDQLHRTLTLKTSPVRIISLVPSLTELIVDLGLEAQLIGLTKFCIHPSSLKKTKTVIGGTKQVNYEKIKALKPDFILANKEENTPEMIAELEKITTVYVSDINSIDDMLSCIDALGILCNKMAEATKILASLRRELTTFHLFIKEVPMRKVAYFIWHDPWMVVGQENFINTVLRMNKFENIIKTTRYPMVELADIEQADPDLILLSSEPFPFDPSHRAYFSITNQAKVHFVNGEYFSWYGSRFLKALTYFRTLHNTLC